MRVVQAEKGKPPSLRARAAPGRDHGRCDALVTHGPAASQSHSRRWLTCACHLQVKCDRGQPCCGWCSRNNAVCEYRERKKPGLRAGYGRELEQRLDRLEAVLRTHSEILRTSVDTGDHDTPREMAPRLFAPRPDLIRTPRAETALFLQKPSTYPPPPPAAPPGVDFGIPQSSPSVHHDGFQGQMGVPAFSPAHAPHAPALPSVAVPEFFGTGLPQPPSLDMNPTQSQILPDQDLPPYDLLYALVDLYFKHINTWSPILHRKATLDSLFGPSMISEADKILLHAIVATTLRFSTDARLTDERRQHWHDASKRRVLLYGLENSSVKALQALVVLALDISGTSNGPPGWNIISLIARASCQLGLAVESNSFCVSPSYASIYTLRAVLLPDAKDFVEEESRRRLFWMVYILDRYTTVSTAFDFALNDKEIDRTLPCRDDLWVKNQKVETRLFHVDERPEGNPDYQTNRPENLGSFGYYVEILGILSKIHTFLRQPVDISALSDVEEWQLSYKALDNMLTSWKFGLPGEYGNMAKLFQPGSAKTLNVGWVMLHATYHTAVIRLHSSAAYPTTRSPIFTPSFVASQRCHQAVENIAALGEFVLANGLLSKLGPPFAFTLWVSARLLLVHASTVEHKISTQIRFFVEVLKEMGAYWAVAARYAQILQRVLDEYRESERQGDGVTPSSVKILADMRRTAFDLDFLISRQPRRQAAAAATTTNGSSSAAGNAPPAQAALYGRPPSVTPARTPQPNELEYLDVFDFFNVPRLPPVGAPPGTNGGGATVASNGTVAAEAVPDEGANEFNITDFSVDASRDWLFKQEGAAKF